MELQPLHSILVLGLGLGWLHAMDADHIMAVSVLAANKKQRKKSWQALEMIRFCGAWAVGHGCTLLLLTALLIFIGVELPAVVSQLAEKLIGVILIAMGAWILWHICSGKLYFQAHSHQDVTHVHLSHKHKKEHNHQPVLVGVTHGLAGSAPVLALVPAMESSNAWFALGYVALFSLGVLMTMIVFGLGFGYVQSRLIKLGERVYQWSRSAIAVLSIGFGSYWLLA